MGRVRQELDVVDEKQLVERLAAAGRDEAKVEEMLPRTGRDDRVDLVGAGAGPDPQVQHAGCDRSRPGKRCEYASAQ